MISFEDVFKEANNNNNNFTIRIALIARYQFYLWLKKNNLIPTEYNPITEENKKQFIKWVQL